MISIWRRGTCAFALIALISMSGVAQAQEPEPEADNPQTMSDAVKRSFERIRAELERLEATRGTAATLDPELEDELSGARSPVLARRRRVMPLTLDEAIRMALRNDLGLQIALEQSLASATAVPRARADFDPTFQVSFSKSRTRRTSIFQNPLTGLPANAVTNQFDRITTSAGLTQLVPTGGTVSLDWTQTRSETKGATNNPQIDVSTSLTFTQPLLRGRGFEVTLANLRNARLSRANSFTQLAQTVQGLILQVRQAYWAVVSAEENLRVQQANLVAAAEFLEGEKARLDLKAGRQLDVAVAEAAVARRQEDVIRAETQIENARDALLNRIAPSADLLAWDVFLVPLDRPTYVAPPRLDLELALTTAFDRRFDLMIARRAIERDERNLFVAENGVLPSLDLSLTAGLAATAEKHHNAYRTLDPPEDAFNLRGGLTLRFPLFFRAERANLAQAQHTLRATELSLEQSKAAAILEIRQAMRAIISARERVVVNQQSVKLSERQLNTERESVQLGLSIARDLLDAQQDLANARLALQSSLIDYREAIAAYEASLGILVDRYRDELPTEARLALDGSFEPESD